MPAADWCEVELLFDNSDGRLADLDFSEVSILRRLHRGGEGQYLVNRAPVRRTDLVELLSDVGLGTGMHSVVGQGKVEAILASSPAERRALVEEAAGLGRFKRRRHRAELKLARVAREVERARDVEAEARKRLRPLALQATAAERAEKLGRQIASAEARIAELDLAELSERQAHAEERKAASGLERKRVEGQLESLLLERGRVEDELADAAGRREAATAALYRLRSASERVALRAESLGELAERLRHELEAARVARPSHDAEQTLAAAKEAARERDRLTEQASAAAERLRALERSLAEREGIPPAARELSERGHALVLDGMCRRAGLRTRGRRRARVPRLRGHGGERVRRARAGRGRTQPRARPPVRPRSRDGSADARRGADAGRGAARRPRPRAEPARGCLDRRPRRSFSRPGVASS